MKVAHSKVSHERWLVSYADFITLLFGFFVVLYAFSKTDQKKHAEVSAAIDTGFQTLSIASALPAFRSHPAANQLSASTGYRDMSDRLTTDVRVYANLDRIRRDLETRLSSQIAQGTIAITLGRDGLVVSLREAGFFESGTAVPRPDTAVTLREIASSFEGIDYDVRIEGHTDDVPIHNAAFDSNWELSSTRATHIARMLIAMRTLKPEQVSAAGYAEFHPVASNDNAAGRAQNRRVDLVVMPHVLLSAPTADSASDISQWHTITGQ